MISADNEGERQRWNRLRLSSTAPDRRAGSRIAPPNHRIAWALSPRGGRAIAIGVSQKNGFAGIIALMLLVTACGAADPYIYRPGEFNRQSPDFNREPADIAEVSICYQRLATDREDVAALAEERCRQFDRTAEFLGTRYGDCPLLTFSRARYACVLP
jgi:hypothetical protein